MTGNAIQRMFDLLAKRTAEAEEKATAVRDALAAADPAALAVADGLKKSSALGLLGSGSGGRNLGASDFGTFAVKSAKDDE